MGHALARTPNYSPFSCFGPVQFWSPLGDQKIVGPFSIFFELEEELTGLVWRRKKSFHVRIRQSLDFYYYKNYLITKLLGWRGELAQKVKCEQSDSQTVSCNTFPALRLRLRLHLRLQSLSLDVDLADPNKIIRKKVLELPRRNWNRWMENLMGKMLFFIWSATHSGFGRPGRSTKKCFFVQILK